MEDFKESGQKNLEEEVGDEDALAEVRQREVAMRTIYGAWDEAISEGVLPDMLASAAVFAAFSDMIVHYGEDAVAEIASGLAERIRRGDFTIHRTIH